MSAISQPVRTVWHLDAQHFEVGFAVRHLMISSVKGRFHGVKAVVSSDGDDFSSATVEAAIDASTLDTRDSQRDGHLRSADFFDVESFPEITFRSTRVDKESDGRFRLTGDIAIHGVTKPITLDVQSEGFVRDPWGNERAGFHLKGAIKRTDFGLSWNQALEAGGVLVGDEVKLALEIELVRQAAK